jgi:hypothetical protein
MKHKFNYSLCAALAKFPSDPIRELIADYSELHQEVQSIEHMLSLVTEEATRLKHENEFMLRLIDKYMQEHVS